MAKRKTTLSKGKKAGIVLVRDVKDVKEEEAVVRVARFGIASVRAAKAGGEAVVRIAGRGIYTKKLGAKLAFSAKPMNTRKYHVILGNGEKWTVVADGNTRATRIFETKLSAIEFARTIADKIDGEVIIHKETGEIEDRVSLAK